MATLREKHQKAVQRLAEIAEKAKARDFTAEEIAEVDQLSAEADDLDTQIKAADAAQANVARLTGGQPPAKGGQPAPVVQVTDRQEAADAATFGEAFVKSAAYQTFRKQHPAGFGEGTPIDIGRSRVSSLKGYMRTRRGLKADADPLQAGLAHSQAIRMPTVDLTTPAPLTLLDLIDTSGHIEGQSFEYLQITAVTRNAAIVADEILPGDATVKPTSGLSTNLATAHAYTYADGYTVTNQMLSDAPALASYLNSQLGYNIRAVIEDKILNGTGTSGNPFGIRHTTGVQSQAFDTDMLTTLRKAITKLTRIGSPITGIALSPEDDETFDLLRDAEGRYLGQGPWSSGPGTVWGRPRVVSERIEPGTAVLGNWNTVSLLDREGLSVMAFNQHKDYAARNLVYVRGELRAAQAIWKPAQLCIATLTDDED